MIPSVIEVYKGTSVEVNTLLLSSRDATTKQIKQFLEDDMLGKLHNMPYWILISQTNNDQPQATCTNEN